ncbi:MAG: mechanosensitive ion channel family protein [Hyphomicrobiales bacterium]
MDSYHFSFSEYLYKLFGGTINSNTDTFFFAIIDIGIDIIIALIIYLILRVIIIRYLHFFTKKTKTHWDDILSDRGVFRRLTLIIPAFILHILLPISLQSNPGILHLLQKVLNIYITFIIAYSLNAILNSINDIYSYFQVSRSRPIKGVIQAVIIIIYFISILVFISIAGNMEFEKIFIGLGTVSAVLLLIFRDALLGFVAGLQISFNNLVQIGDWIVMKNAGADGDVIDITLTTVKVQNFDKTIVTIPTYQLISDSFQNYRGMEESGGRRIKRSINIDLASIKFCNQELLDKLHNIKILQKYIDNKNQEIENHNKNIEDTDLETANLINKRTMTNVGMFRAYIDAYLHENANIYNSRFTFLIRQLQSTDKGLPLEIYVFTTTTNWVEYEKIQSDIFDHFFATLPLFELQAYQNPSGRDIQNMKINN